MWAFWLLLTDNTGWREMLAGAGASAISMLAIMLFVDRIKANFRFRARFLKQAIHVPKQLVTDTGLLVFTIARRIAGVKPASGIMAVRFRRGGNMPSSMARRALAVTYLTVSPNTLVLGISEHQNILVFHTIVPAPLPPFVERMGAEPEQEA
jgi:multisubunit Na+/H+ antiporter MnhE subunit